MLSKEKVKVALTVVAGFGIAFLIVGTSPSFQSCVQEHQQHAAHSAFQEYVGSLYKTVRGCGGEWLHKNGEAIIALFTVILGIATWLLWRSTKALVAGAEQTAERQLRAYVHVENAEIIHSNDEWRPNIRISVKNYGQTPAREVRHKIDNALVLKGPGNFDLKPDDSTCDLGPSQGFTKTFPLITRFGTG